MENRWIAAVLALLLCLSACGSKSKEAPTQPETTQAITTQPATTQPETTQASTTQPEITQPAVEASSESQAPVPTVEAPAESEPAAPAGIRPEFKDAMDSYEAFYNDYCEIMAKYAKNPTDLSILGKYADMLAKAEEMDKKFKAWDEGSLSNEELKYYLDVMNRVQKKMIDLF